MKLTVSQTAALLSITEPELYAWFRDRALPHVRVQDCFFVHRDQLYEWAHDHHVRLHPEVFGAASQAGADALADALHNGGVRRCPPPSGAEDGARALVAQLNLPRSVPVGAVSAIVAARPELGFAVDADGIALPRVCEPLLAPAPASVTMFAFEPAWCLGKTPITRAFFVVAPTVAEHHAVLAALDAALYDARFREAVARVEPGEALEALVRHTSVGAFAAAK